MRLWHKDLICVLPTKQLVSQWRECCCIAKNLALNGTPNHILVNKILDYPPSHFCAYTELVLEEMTERGYKYSSDAITNFYCHLDKVADNYHTPIKKEDIFKEWHGPRYLQQCYYNLQEKYDCGGITEEEWKKISQLYFS